MVKKGKGRYQASQQQLKASSKQKQVKSNPVALAKATAGTENMAGAVSSASAIVNNKPPTQPGKRKHGDLSTDQASLNGPSDKKLNNNSVNTSDTLSEKPVVSNGDIAATAVNGVTMAPSSSTSPHPPSPPGTAPISSPQHLPRQGPPLTSTPTDISSHLAPLLPGPTIAPINLLATHPQNFCDDLEHSLSQPRIIHRFRHIFNVEAIKTNSTDIQNLKTFCSDLKETVDTQAQVISSLKNELTEVKTTHEKFIVDLVEEINDINQYSRRNSLRISNPNWIEMPHENTNGMVLELAHHLGVNLNEWDIDRSHRVGKHGAGRQRQILVKFVGYGSRRALYEAGIRMRRDRQRPAFLSQIFINEDLTSINNTLFYLARQKVRENKFDSVVTRDGRVLVRTHAGGNYVEVKSEADLELNHSRGPYSHIVAGGNHRHAQQAQTNAPSSGRELPAHTNVQPADPVQHTQKQAVGAPGASLPLQQTPGGVASAQPIQVKMMAMANDIPAPKVNNTGLRATAPSYKPRPKENSVVSEDTTGNSSLLLQRDGGGPTSMVTGASSASTTNGDGTVYY